MKATLGIIECLAGERFPQIISGFDYDTASQITVLIYRDLESGHSLSFVKTPSEQYPKAGLITKREEDGKMLVTIDTTGLSIGRYDMEARVDVVGVAAPIVKQRSEFMTIKPSRT